MSDMIDLGNGVRVIADGRTHRYISELRMRIESAEAALRYYASKNTNMLRLSDDYEVTETDPKTGEQYAAIGKRARAHFAKYPQ